VGLCGDSVVLSSDLAILLFYTAMHWHLLSRNATSLRMVGSTDGLAVQPDKPALCVFWLQIVVRALAEAPVAEIYWPLQLSLTYIWRCTWAVRACVLL
jgi:hypothetical protein